MDYFYKNTIPKEGQQAYYNDNYYKILMVTNIDVTDSKRDKFPLTVVYQNISTGKIYSLPYWYFNKFYSYTKRDLV